MREDYVKGKHLDIMKLPKPPARSIEYYSISRLRVKFMYVAEITER